MPRAWSPKRERQYKHIKQEQLKDGKSVRTAEEIAARTVNKTRAQAGEAKTASKSSLNDMSPARRGGIRSHRKSPRGRTKQQLYNEARQKGIEDRSKMTKAELEQAVDT